MTHSPLPPVTYRPYEFRGDDARARSLDVIHRVNTYDALVGAMTRTSKMLEREYLHFTKDTPEAKAIADLRQALTLAKETPK